VTTGAKKSSRGISSIAVSAGFCDRSRIVSGVRVADFQVNGYSDSLGNSKSLDRVERRSMISFAVMGKALFWLQ
jgi:hypothetical protein